MDTKPSKQVLEFVREMMPHDGACGVDLYSAAFQDMLTEHFDPDDKAARTKFTEEVKNVLAYIGQNGFAILTPD